MAASGGLTRGRRGGTIRCDLAVARGRPGAALPSPAGLGVVSGLASLAGPAFNVVVNSHVYRVTPDRLLGRVRGAARLVACGSIPLGALSGGFLASALGARPALLVLTGIMCGVAAAATLARGMREFPASSGAGTW